MIVSELIKNMATDGMPSTKSASVVEEEIETLKSSYGSDIHFTRNNYRPNMANKVIIGIGNCRMRVTFNLTDKYPDDSPQLFIESSILTDCENDNLLDCAQQICEDNSVKTCINNVISMIYCWIIDKNIDVEKNAPIYKLDDTGLMEQETGSIVPCKFYLQNKCRFGDKCFNLHEGSPADQSDSCRKIRTSPTNSETSPQKKKPMKTASDVISRILWDDSLSADKFTVGYIDRFIGIIERQFTAFSWEDLSSVDYDALAIPQHRIQYFKYANHKVWDKKTRLDLLFGSTDEASNGSNLYELIKQWDAEAPQATLTSNELLSKYHDPELTEHSPMAEVTIYNDNRQRPTHFIAFRITDMSILGEIRNLFNHIIKMQPELEGAMSGLSRLHLTVCMLTLTSAQQIVDAVHALQNLRYHIPLTPIGGKMLSIHLRGINHFGNRVIYLDSDTNPQLQDYMRSVQNYLHREGISVMHNFECVPHVTVVKMSRIISRSLHSQLIDPSVYQEYLEHTFGTHSLTELVLCPIGENTDRDTFYRTITTVPINCDA